MATRRLCCCSCGLALSTCGFHGKLSVSFTQDKARSPRHLNALSVLATLLSHVADFKADGRPPKQHSVYTYILARKQRILVYPIAIRTNSPSVLIAPETILSGINTPPARRDCSHCRSSLGCRCAFADIVATARLFRDSTMAKFKPSFLAHNNEHTNIVHNTRPVCAARCTGLQRPLPMVDATETGAARLGAPWNFVSTSRNPYSKIQL